jgi:hypothetical protein
MDVSILGQLDRFKTPALAQAVKGRIAAKPAIVLVSRSGFTTGLRKAAEREERIQLVDLDRLASPA